MSMTSQVIAILQYLHDHDDSFEVGKHQYQNEVTLLISSNILFPNGRTLFPQNRLHAFRLDRREMFIHADLLAWVAHLIFEDRAAKIPREIWFTGSHLADSKQWIMQVSFE